MRRSIMLTTAAAGGAILLGLAPIAAAAAPVPYVYAWESGTLIELTDPVAGVGEVVPTTNPANAVTGLDLDGTGVGYAVSYNGEALLHSVNVLTGVVTDLGILTFNGFPVIDCTGLDLTGGVLTVVCDFVDGQDGDSTYLTVDTATLVTTLITSSEVRVASIATNPIDGVLYGFGYSGEIMSVTGAGAAQVGSVSDGRVLWGADFANDGSLWGAVNSPETPVTVGAWTFFPANADVDGGDEFVENLTVYEAAAPVVPSPALVATGAEQTPVALGAIAILVVGAGIAIVVANRRRAA